MQPHSQTESEGRGQYKVIDNQNRVEDKWKGVTNCPEAGRFRTILPQFVASVVKNFLLLNSGLSDGFPAIIIPVLTGINKQNNPNETVSLTAAQASWLGSTSCLFKFCGSALSGWVTEPIGRKNSLLLMCIPFLIGFGTLYNSSTVHEIYLAHVLFGLTIGLMQAPHSAYLGEISEPSVRGVLMSMQGFFVTSGLLIVFLLGNLTEWRTVALLCMIMPIVTIVTVSCIPETPIWLLSRNRQVDALKALQWLRGWVSPEAVQYEFEDIQRYSEYSNACSICMKANEKCLHPPSTFKQNLKELVRKKTLKPYFILIFLALIGQFCGTQNIMPYMVQILKAYGSPISPSWAVVIVGATGLAANLLCICTIKLVGKRGTYLMTLSGVCLSHIALGIYGLYYLSPGCTSFDSEHLTSTIKTANKSFVPLILFVFMRFCSTGFVIVPIMLTGELFPFKSRGFATGLTRATTFVFAFVAIKSFYNLENWLSLQGVMLLYGGIGVIGLITAYVILPETENLTLEDIEIHFSDNKRKITDHKIRKNAAAIFFKETIVDCDKAIDDKPLNVTKNGK